MKGVDAACNDTSQARAAQGLERCTLCRALCARRSGRWLPIACHGLLLAADIIPWTEHGGKDIARPSVSASMVVPDPCSAKIPQTHRLPLLLSKSFTAHAILSDRPRSLSWVSRVALLFLPLKEERTLLPSSPSFSFSCTPVSWHWRQLLVPRTQYWCQSDASAPVTGAHAPVAI